MTSSSTKTMLVITSLLLACAIAGFSYEFYAIHREVAVSADLESRVLGQKLSTETIDNLRSIQTNYVDEIGKIDTILIAKDNPVPFLDLLEKSGQRLGLKLHVNGVTVEEGKGTRDDKLTVSLETEGSWQETMAFVHAVESLPYYVMVNNLSLTTDTVSGETVAKQVWHGSATLVLNAQ